MVVVSMEGNVGSSKMTETRCSQTKFATRGEQRKEQEVKHCEEFVLHFIEGR